MSQISTIQYSDVLESRRFDAEYFKPEYVKILDIIKNSNFLPLGKISIIKSGTTPKDRDGSLKEGVVLLKTRDIRNNILSDKGNDFFYVSNDIDKRMQSTHLKEKDVLLNIVGATTDVIGRVSLIPSNFPESNITQAMAFCRVYSSKISPEYLFVFLQTRFGKQQTKRLARPTGQFNLNLQEVSKLLIPIVDSETQNRIERMIENAHQKQSQSKQLYKEAGEMLLQELDITEYRPKDALTFETTKSAVDEADRCDAEYFQPKYEEIIERIEKYEGGFDTAGNMVKWKKGIEVGAEAYQEDGKDFIRVADITPFGIESCDKRISGTLFEKLKGEFSPKAGEILFTKDGTVGISYLLEEDIDGIISGAFLRLTLKKKYERFKKECLTLILNSLICHMQIEKLSGGALIAHLKPSDFDKLRIPLIKREIQEKISEKVHESYALRKESKALLEKAKKMVEDEIERGGK